MSQKTLLIDLSFPVAQVGLFQENRWLAFYQREKAALEAIFEGVDYCQKKASLGFQDIDRLIMCEGPGSILGLRLASMAVETWLGPFMNHELKLYTYYSLCVQAIFLMDSGEKPPFHLISYFRSGKWSYLKVTDEGKLSEPCCIADDALSLLEGKCFGLFSGKQIPAIAYEKVNYDLSRFPGISDREGFLCFKEKPEVFTPFETRYAHWKGERHGMREIG